MKYLRAWKVSRRAFSVADVAMRVGEYAAANNPASTSFDRSRRLLLSLFKSMEDSEDRSVSIAYTLT
jgi:hypothetical protein